MAISSNYTFQCVPDRRTQIAAYSSAFFLTATVVTLLSLTSRYLIAAQLGYPIAAASGLSIATIGFLVATVRKKIPKTQTIKQEETPAPPEPLIPLEKAIQLAKWAEVDPNPSTNHLPSKTCPFVTTEFTLKFCWDDQRVEHKVPIAYFEEDSDKVYAHFIYADQVHVIEITKMATRKFSGLAWTGNNGKVDVSDLNKEIGCLDGFLSYPEAKWRLHSYITDNQPAAYFLIKNETNSSEHTLSFSIPNYSGFSIKGSFVIFTRDASVALIHTDQLALLEKSNIKMHQNLYQQLNDSSWMYKCQTDDQKSIKVTDLGEGRLQVSYKLKSSQIADSSNIEF